MRFDLGNVGIRWNADCIGGDLARSYLPTASSFRQSLLGVPLRARAKLRSYLVIKGFKDYLYIKGKIKKPK